MAFGRLLAKKRSFLLQVYTLIIFQLAITAGMVFYTRHNQELYTISRKYFILWLMILLILVFILTSRAVPLSAKLFLFTFMSFILGMNLIAASTLISPQTIKSAIAATLGVVVAMTFLAFILASAGVDVSYMSFMLFCALLSLLIAWVVTLFVKPSTVFIRGLLIIGVTLFSIFIAYDTNVLLMTDQRDVVQGALGLYLDIINLFSNMLGLDS